MFFWMKLKGISDTKKLIQEKALAKEVRKYAHFNPYQQSESESSTPDSLIRGLHTVICILHCVARSTCSSPGLFLLSGANQATFLY